MHDLIWGRAHRHSCHSGEPASHAGSGSARSTAHTQQAPKGSRAWKKEFQFTVCRNLCFSEHKSCVLTDSSTFKMCQRHRARQGEGRARQAAVGAGGGGSWGPRPAVSRQHPEQTRVWRWAAPLGRCCLRKDLLASKEAWPLWQSTASEHTAHTRTPRALCLRGSSLPA